MKLVYPLILIKITQVDRNKGTRPDSFQTKKFFSVREQSQANHQSNRPHSTTSINPLTKSKIELPSHKHKMSSIRQRLINKRDEQVRTDIALQLHDPPTVEDRPIDATYVYPTGNFVMVNGKPMEQVVIQRAVEPKDLDKLLSRSRACAQIRKDAERSNTANPRRFGIDEEKRNMGVDMYADKAFKLLRERLFEKMPSVQTEKYPHIGFLTLMDIKAGLREKFEYSLPSHPEAFLDSYVAGLLTGLGYGQNCCEVCGMVFDDQKALDNHKKNSFHTSFQCGLDGCQRELCSVDAVNFHCRLIHGWNARDGTPFTEAEEVEKSSHDHNGGEECNVDGCRRVFKTRRGLATHKRMAHK